jgi:hypothetical protein
MKHRENSMRMLDIKGQMIRSENNMADVKGLFDGFFGCCNPWLIFLILILLVVGCCGGGCGI